MINEKQGMADNLSNLHRFIVTRYRLEDLRTLCLNMSVEYQNLGGEGLSGKARELILQMGRRGKLDLLLTALQQSRPELFSRAGFSTDPAALEALYAELPRYEAERTKDGAKRVEGGPIDLDIGIAEKRIRATAGDAVGMDDTDKILGGSVKARVETLKDGGEFVAGSARARPNLLSLVKSILGSRKK
jgi:hypothetical protein